MQLIFQFCFYLSKNIGEQAKAELVYVHFRGLVEVYFFESTKIYIQIEKVRKISQSYKILCMFNTDCPTLFHLRKFKFKYHSTVFQTLNFA